MTKKKEVLKEKTRWQQQFEEQLEEYKEKNPARASILLSHSQNCLVVKAPTDNTALKAFSLVWEGDKCDHIIEVKYGCSDKLEQEYFMSTPGDIITVRYNGSSYLFEENKTKRNMIKNFIKNQFKGEVPVKDFDKAIWELTQHRAAILAFECKTGLKLIR